jgi:hypothetical protein
MPHNPDWEPGELQCYQEMWWARLFNPVSFNLSESSISLTGKMRLLTPWVALKVTRTVSF